MADRFCRFGVLLLLVVVISGCASEGLIQNKSMKRGFNLLQHERVAWDSDAAAESMAQLADLGANAVVVIAFMEQPFADSQTVHRSDAVTMRQLAAAIARAKHEDMHVILKPQMLVPGAWAGAINHRNRYGWHAWFTSYSEQLIEFAIFAQRHGVDALVIGTELKQAAAHVDWPRLISQLRRVFRGELTYAAHNIDGVKQFAHWQLLDAVSLTLYPSLGEDGSSETMAQHIEASVAELEQIRRSIDKPLWVLEIGMPSARGAFQRPWEWHGLKQTTPDMALQQRALSIWLRALDKPWVDGVYIWAWYSSPKAGGHHDSDYTPQNKPAIDAIDRYW